MSGFVRESMGPEPRSHAEFVRMLLPPQMLPQSAMPKIDMSPEAQLRWALGYIRRRYAEVELPPPWRRFVSAWYARQPLSPEGLRALRVLRMRTGQWMTVGQLMRRADLPDGVIALEAIERHGIRLEFTRTAGHQEPVIAYAWREASGSALLRVRLA